MDCPNSHDAKTYVSPRADAHMSTPFDKDIDGDRNREFIRAEREDDDGYDPYSDRIEVTPMFERDPWR